MVGPFLHSDGDVFFDHIHMAGTAKKPIEYPIKIQVTHQALKDVLRSDGTPEGHEAAIKSQAWKIVGIAIAKALSAKTHEVTITPDELRWAGI